MSRRPERKRLKLLVRYEKRRKKLRPVSARFARIKKSLKRKWTLHDNRRNLIDANRSRDSISEGGNT
jgi:hypothetical protein